MTGTLTQDRVVLKRHLDADGNESGEVLELAWLNSHYQTGLRNLLDVAVLRARRDASSSAWPRTIERSTNCRSTSSAAACRSSSPSAAIGTC